MDILLRTAIFSVKFEGFYGEYTIAMAIDLQSSCKNCLNPIPKEADSSLILGLRTNHNL